MASALCLPSLRLSYLSLFLGGGRGDEGMRLRVAGMVGSL